MNSSSRLFEGKFHPTFVVTATLPSIHSTQVQPQMSQTLSSHLYCCQITAQSTQDFLQAPANVPDILDMHTNVEQSEPYETYVRHHNT